MQAQTTTHADTQEITDLILQAAEKAQAETSHEPEPALTHKVDWPVACTINHGLDGAIANETKIGYVNGSKGWLIYRGYNIFDLAAHSTFEEVTYLLITGKAPTRAELDEFKQKLFGYMGVSETIKHLSALPIAKMNPMAGLSLGVNILRHEGEGVDNLDAAFRLVGGLAAITGAVARTRAGEKPVAPDPELSFAGNFLYMMTGKKPTPTATRIMDVALILHADHGSNASTFTAMVVASTLSDLFFAVDAGIGALNGPLHGGANAEVLLVLKEIGSVDKVKSWYEQARAAKRKIMGFGHRVYKAYDPRARILEPLAAHLAQGHEEARKLIDIAHALEQEVISTLGAQKGIFPNVDFYSGLVYQNMEIPRELFTPIFAVSRVAGWAARVLEYVEDNRIFRPRAVYVGPFHDKFTPIEERG